MKALILAAGEGRRLRPHTNDQPKCMVKLAGRPLINYQLQALKQAGVSDITVVTGYRAEALEVLGVPTRHNPLFDRTNMVRSMMCAADVFDGTDDVLVCYSDIVYGASVLSAVGAAPHALSTVVDLHWRELWQTRFSEPLSDAESLKLDNDGCIVELGRKPDSIESIEGQYIGMTKIRADHCSVFVDLYRGLPEDGMFDGKDLDNMYMTSFLQHIVDSGHQLHAVKVHGGWIEVDTVEDLEQYEQLNASDQLSRFVQLPGSSGTA